MVLSPQFTVCSVSPQILFLCLMTSSGRRREEEEREEGEGVKVECTGGLLCSRMTGQGKILKI